MNYTQLSKDYKSFHYRTFKYSVDEHQLKLEFQYELEGRERTVFTHKVSYRIEGDELFNTDKIKTLETLIFHIGMVETINYWKLACPKEVHIHCGNLSEEQKKWWKKLYYNGLGEFIYLNKMVDQVNEENFVNFVNEVNGDDYSLDKISLPNSMGNLIPVGGGKDSVVTLEILKESKENNLPFVMSAPVAAYDCISVAGYTNYLEAKRVFDKQMIDMNGKGFLNGHVPFSAILAFIAILGAALTGKRYIPLSNERSANEPSVIGTTFNHQYSKSFEFEEDFDWYLHQFLVNEIKYFSVLRPLYEIQIGELFSHYEQYHKVYRSCNRGKKENAWCGECPKCLFVYTILSPYIPRTLLVEQFGKDLLEDEELKDIFNELIGLSDTKPFECVGTIWEVRHAVNLALENYGNAKLLDYYKKIDGMKLNDSPLEYEEGDLLPDEHRARLIKEMKRFDK